MTLDEILEKWQEDSEVDKTELGEEVLKIPKLHHKYMQILTYERMTMKATEAEYNKLRLLKYEFYTQGHNEETREKGWKLPPRGMILKADIPYYMDADNELSQLKLKIDLQKEKVDLCESIIKAIMHRGYNIKSAIEWIKFTMAER